VAAGANANNFEQSPPRRTTINTSSPTTTNSTTSTRSTPGTAPQEGINKTEAAEEQVQRGLQSSMAAISNHNELGSLLSGEHIAFILATFEEQFRRIVAAQTTSSGTAQAGDRLHKRGRSSASSSSGFSPDKCKPRTDDTQTRTDDTQILMGDGLNWADLEEGSSDTD